MTQLSKTFTWRAACLATLALASAAVIGCSATPSASAPVAIASDEYPRMFQAAVEVLREQGFVVDRQDYRFGQIGAQPLVSPTIAEPWRRSVSTPKQALDSTLNHQRRLITVSLDPVDKSAAPAADQPAGTVLEGDYTVRVEVVIEESQVPVRFLTGSTRGNAVFGHLRDVPAELDGRGIAKAYWVPVGRDPYLEERLLREIVRHSVSVQLPDAGAAPVDAPAAEDRTKAPPVGELVK